MKAPYVAFPGPRHGAESFALFFSPLPMDAPGLPGSIAYVNSLLEHLHHARTAAPSDVVWSSSMTIADGLAMRGDAGKAVLVTLSWRGSLFYQLFTATDWCEFYERNFKRMILMHDPLGDPIGYSGVHTLDELERQRVLSVLDYRSSQSEYLIGRRIAEHLGEQVTLSVKETPPKRDVHATADDVAEVSVSPSKRVASPQPLS